MVSFLEPIPKMRLSAQCSVAVRLKMLTYQCMLRFFAKPRLALNPDLHFWDAF
jgi:hypothetical protein